MLAFHQQPDVSKKLVKRQQQRENFSHKVEAHRNKIVTK